MPATTQRWSKRPPGSTWGNTRAGVGCCAALPLHEHCLFGLLTAPPLRVPGAVTSPVVPVGTT